MTLADLLLGRWEDTLPDYSSETFDAIITDPPYQITDEDNESTRKKLNGWSEGNMKPLGAGETMDWDYNFQNLPWLKEAYRVLKPGAAIVAFCDGKRPGELWDDMERAGFVGKQTLYWVKTNPPTNPRKNYQSGVETMVFARKPGKILFWNGGGASLNYWKGPIVHHKHRFHPTQKPVALFRWLLNLHVPQYGLFLDPFAGSGSSLVAGQELALRGLGIDADPRYRDSALDWLVRSHAELTKVPAATRIFKAPKVHPVLAP